jgi:polar amino acid transport system permease protein
MIVDWAFALAILPVLAEAAWVTVGATAAGYGCALVVGLAFALLRRSRSRVVAWPVGLAIEFLRGTPLLIQLYFLYFVLPDLGVILPSIAAGLVALGLHYSAYTAEVYRAGIDAIPRGQWQAAAALGLRPMSVYRHVVIPQAVPPMVPALGNYLIAMFKDTPMLSAIAVVELMQQAKIIGSESFRYLEPITLAGLFFLGMSLIAAGIMRRVERRLRSRRALAT